MISLIWCNFLFDKGQNTGELYLNFLIPEDCISVFFLNRSVIQFEENLAITNIGHVSMTSSSPVTPIQSLWGFFKDTSAHNLIWNSNRDFKSTKHSRELLFHVAHAQFLSTQLKRRCVVFESALLSSLSLQTILHQLTFFKQQHC